MSIYDSIKPTLKLEGINSQAVKYWRNSYSSPKSRYFSQGDEEGDSVIVKFECEEKSDYKKRLDMTPFRNFCFSIINKYGSSVFRNEAAREWEASIGSNIDLMGSTMNSFMKKLLIDAQIEGSAYAMVDSTIGDTSEFMTAAQTDGLNPYFVNRIPKDNVVLEEVTNSGLLVEIAFVMEKADGTAVLRWYSATETAEWAIVRNKVGVQTIAPTPHGYIGIPVVRMAPFPDTAQIATIADSQRQICNLESLVSQELVDSTFTKHILSGVRSDPNDPSQKVVWGSKRITLLDPSNTQDPKLFTLGADKSQADSIRESIAAEVESLYRNAGLTSASFNVESAQMSGVSRLIARADFFLVVSILAEACSVAENKLLELMGIDAKSEYPTDFNEPDITEDLGSLREILALDVPQVLKNKMIQKFAERHFTLDDADKKDMERELLGSPSTSQEQVVEIPS